MVTMGPDFALLLPAVAVLLGQARRRTSEVFKSCIQEFYSGCGNFTRGIMLLVGEGLRR